MPERVEELDLTLTYPDGHVARFSGSNLRAEITFSQPEFPDLEVQQAFPFKLEAAEPQHLHIDITLDLRGKLLAQLGKEIRA